MDIEIAQNIAQLFPATYSYLRDNGKITADVAPANVSSDMPESTSEITNTLATGPLWQGVSSKAVNIVDKIITPIMPFVTDVKHDLNCANPDAMPIVKVPVYTGFGEALENTKNWEQSNVTRKHVAVEATRISLPACITLDEIRYGDKVEDIALGLIKGCAQGVYKKFLQAVTAAVSPTAEAAMTPALCKKIAAIFGDDREVLALLLDNVNYSTLIPTNNYELNPAVEGTFGIRHIKKTAMLKTGINGIALAEGAVSGFVGSVNFKTEVTHLDVRYMGDVAGLPIHLKTWFKPGDERLWMSAESVCGFVVNDASLLKTFTFGATAES